jgi:hypothetical protein
VVRTFGIEVVRMFGIEVVKAYPGLSGRVVCWGSVQGVWVAE